MNLSIRPRSRRRSSREVRGVSQPPRWTFALRLWRPCDKLVRSRFSLSYFWEVGVVALCPPASQWYWNPRGESSSKYQISRERVFSQKNGKFLGKKNPVTSPPLISINAILYCCFGRVSEASTPPGLSPSEEWSPSSSLAPHPRIVAARFDCQHSSYGSGCVGLSGERKDAVCAANSSCERLLFPATKSTQQLAVQAFMRWLRPAPH